MPNGCNTQALGECSHAEGNNTIASGFASHAEGFSTQAVGDVSHAGGLGTTAIGFMSYTEGQNTIASGLLAHAEGYNTVALGETSHAEGRNSQALGAISHAEGISTTAGNVGDNDSGAHAEGYETFASGLFGSHAEGAQTLASGASSHAEGRNTIASGSNSHAEGAQTLASGASSHAEGNNTTASGDHSHAEGIDTLAAGVASHAEGDDTIASGPNSHAEGESTLSSGIASHAEGFETEASGDHSHAEGLQTIASGANSHAEGESTNTAVFSNTHIMGRFGNADEANSWFIANGLDDANRGIGAKWSGSTFNMSIDGPTYIAGGADYAEMFETLDGNPIEPGYFVTLDGDKIKKATAEDSFILGITSAVPSICGNSADLSWHGKYLTDEWGRKKYHEVTIEEVKDSKGNVIRPKYTEIRPMLNPEWDNTIKYVSRMKRPEWVAVGLIGQILVRDDGTCMKNGYCRVNEDGIATAAESGYRVMKRTGPNQILVLFR